MSPGSLLIPDTVVSLAAIVGLLVVIRRIRAFGTRNDLARSFASTLSVVALFLTLRILHWNTTFEFFRFATYATAALIPLMVLLLTENLLRRHAPKWAKIFVSAGALLLAIASIWSEATGGNVFTYALLGFQVTGFVIVGGMVVARDHGSLTDTENRMIVRVGLSLLVIFPFLLSDYRTAVASLPVRLSGLAILITCWLALSLARPKLAHGLYLAVLALYVATAAGAAVFMSLQFGFGWRECIQAGAIVLALILVAAIVRDDLHLREEAAQNAIISEVGRPEITSLAAYLDDLARRNVLDGVLILGEADLVEFDRPAIVGNFRGRSTISLADLPARAGDDGLSESQLRALLERYAATHLFEVSRNPLRIAVVRQPGFGASDADRDLSAAFGVARLVSERDTLRARLNQSQEPAT